MASLGKPRITSIDMLRGLVMLLMALDHSRDYLHYDVFFYDPTDLAQTTVPVFFTRLITHLCAPVFCFLAGTSAFFVGLKTNSRSLSAWLIKRGVWLIIVEFTIMKFAWYFRLDVSFFDLGVIWCLGACMIVLAGMIHLPARLAIGIALLLVFGHNLLDNFQPAPDNFINRLWYILHIEGAFTIGGTTLYIVYPLIPWIGLMTLGYYFGRLYLPEVESKKRMRLLNAGGAILLLTFAVFRISNVYGDLHPWVKQDSIMYSILSILNVTKYPPSFSYICLTMGGALLLLSAFEHIKNAFSSILITIGRVPMFFYIIHVYVIHLVAMAACVALGFPASEMILRIWVPFNTALQGYGFTLPVVYVIWLCIMIALYPVCKWYDAYKQSHKNIWWLSYV